MNQAQLQTDAHPLLIIVCVMAGVLYGYLLYRKEVRLKLWLRVGLAAVRAIFVSLLAILLLNPFVKMVRNEPIKPLWVAIADDSESMQAASKPDAPIAKQYADYLQLQEELAQQAALQSIWLSGKKKDPNAFVPDAKKTNFEKPLTDVPAAYEGENLAGVILFSDGITTEGISPDGLDIPFPVHVIATGDTNRKRDVSLKNLDYNDIAFSGNIIPITVNLAAFGLAGKQATVSLVDGTTPLASKTIALPEGQSSVNFTIPAGVAGLRRITAKISPLAGEFTTKNNTASAFIEVLEGKQKILILAAAPHPDIKAIRNALDGLESFETTVCIAGIQEYKPAPYDLVILHHLPNPESPLHGIAMDWINKGAVWFFTAATARNEINLPNQKVVSFLPQGTNPDKVNAILRNDFTPFAIHVATNDLLTKLPPIDVPYGQFTLKADAQILLGQLVGNTPNGQPLLATANSSPYRQGIWIGEGLWAWYMQEYALRQNHEVLDDVIRKTAQYLASKDDKRKLRVLPTNREFSETEAPTFLVETFDDLYQKIGGQALTLTLKDESNKALNFNLTSNLENNRFSTGMLKPGIWKYRAEALIKGKKESTAGQFFVKSFDLEASETTANWDMLRELSRKTGGYFVTYSQMAALKDSLLKNPPVAKLQSSEDNIQWINWQWIMALILALATLEWSMRKYHLGV